MGQQGSSLGGKDGKDGKKEEKKRKYEPPPAPTRVGKRKKKRKGELGGGAAKLPQGTCHAAHFREKSCACVLFTYSSLLRSLAAKWFIVTSM